MNPAAWTLDEPENFLDAKGQEQLVAFLRALKAAGKTIIMTSHHPDIIRSLADRELRLSSDHSLVPLVQCRCDVKKQHFSRQD